MAVIKAHFGLAAIAEDQANWDEAKQHYDAITGMSDASLMFQNLAKAKLERLKEIRQPLLVGIVPEKAEVPKPVDLPSTITPSTTTTTPSTSITTHPSVPATHAPTTKPSATTRPAK